MTLQLRKRDRAYAVKPREMNLSGYDLTLLKMMVRKHWIRTPEMQRIYSELERVK